MTTGSAGRIAGVGSRAPDSPSQQRERRRSGNRRDGRYGAAAYLLVGCQILFATAEGDPSARIDPTRIVEGVIEGIGFLGAGSIIRSCGSVHGVTTGAAIWIAGSIGVARATGNLTLAVIMTMLALVIVLVLGALGGPVSEWERRRADRRGSMSSAALVHPLETVAHQPENTENDQVARDDVVEKFRENQNAYTGGQCNQGCNLYVQGHDNAPRREMKLLVVRGCRVPMPGSPGQGQSGWWMHGVDQPKYFSMIAGGLQYG